MQVLRVAVPDPSSKPAPAPAPAAPAPTPTKPTEAELEAKRKEVAIAMGWQKPDPEPPKVEAPAPVTPAPVVPPVEAPATPAPAPTPTPPAPAAPDVNTVIADTAKAVVDEMKKQDEPAAVVEPELIVQDQEELRVFERMEQRKSVPVGFTALMRAFMLSVYPYQAEWERANPGRGFNPDDDDHSEFFKKQPAYDQDDYDAAKMSLEVDRQVEERINSTVKPKLDQIDRERAEQKQQRLIQEATPLITSQIHTRTASLLGAINADYVKLLVPDGKTVDFSVEGATRFAEAEPFASRVLAKRIMGELVPIIVELERAAVPEAEYAIRKDVGYAISQWTRRFEAAEMKKPAAERNRDGRTFVTIEHRLNALDKIMAGKGSDSVKNQQVQDFDNKHRVVTTDEIEDFIVSEIAREAKAEIDELEGLSAKKHGRNGERPTPKPEAGSQPAPQSVPATAQPGAATNGRERPPSISSASEVVDATKGLGSGEKTFGETARLVHFGK